MLTHCNSPHCPGPRVKGAVLCRFHHSLKCTWNNYLRKHTPLREYWSDVLATGVLSLEDQWLVMQAARDGRVRALETYAPHYVQGAVANNVYARCVADPLAVMPVGHRRALGALTVEEAFGGGGSRVEMLRQVLKRVERELVDGMGDV